MLNFARFVLFLLLFLFISCGEKDTSVHEGAMDGYIGKTYGRSFVLYPAEKDCSKSLSFTASDILSYASFYSGNYNKINRNFMKAQEIKRTFFNFILKDRSYRVYNYYNTNQDFESSKTYLDKEGTNISLCPNYDYSLVSNSSFEGAAASIIGSFSLLNDRLSGFNLSIPLPKIDILIAPKVEVYTDIKGSRVSKENLVNNAFYDMNNKNITFLPQGLSKNQTNIPYSEVPLWTIPFVSFHEYAHHIFASRATSYKHYLLSNPQENLSCFNQFSSLGVKDISVLNYHLLSALNEGFADLFAYYIDSSLARKVFTQIDCFKKNREVNISSFLSGEKKDFSIKNINKFLNEEESAPSKNCEGPIDFSNEHTLGSLFAHSFYSLANSKGLSDENSLRVLLDWVNDLGNMNMNLSSQANLDFLNKNLFLLFGTLNRYAPTTCEEFSKYFTTFKCN